MSTDDFIRSKSDLVHKPFTSVVILRKNYLGIVNAYPSPSPMHSLPNHCSTKPDYHPEFVNVQSSQQTIRKNEPFKLGQKVDEIVSLNKALYFTPPKRFVKLLCLVITLSGILIVKNKKWKFH
ncbi:hypothetical protein [Desulfosporosinus meridiei]|uniref:Uncharacterized protein n=1 Tax=Desulfosporosinus meridiei (strain ATCC BAA-275 / DSM 13257 / KCTC 12902 / NCIMB 13706 / S10) TaxID=768704 RepID=J7IRA5_DESMD|nr:hypothetical protein [Desulfosporosinus meridiei]AFQ44180.1 hypothetical protein Desmer_2244 [Desulfosporosinus meridiei DSM 13257]